MTTFTLRHSESVYADPATVNFDAPLESNLLLAAISERGATSHTNHTLSDANGGTWTKVLGHDQEISDPNARQSFSVWWHEATATDATGAFDITADNGQTVSKRLSVFEIDPSGAYDWTFQVESSDDSGTGSTSPQGSGSTANPGGSDLFVFGAASWRLQSGPSVGSVAFTNLDTGLTSFLGGSNGVTQAVEFSGTGESAAAKTTDVSWTGAGHECACGIVVFSDGAIVAGGPNTGSLMTMGLGI